MAMPSDLAATVGRELAAELSLATGRLEHCLGQLSDSQAWQRERDDMNSVGNLILHLVGNLRQLVVSALCGTPDTRDRQAEFDERRQIPRRELLAMLRSAVAEAVTSIETQREADWLQERLVRGEMATALNCVIRSIAHFRGHTQEIIHLTRTILGEAYRYAGPPPGKR